MIEWLTAETVEMYQPTGTVEDLVPAVRPQFDALLAQATTWGMKPHVRSAGRTCAQQAEQVKLGYSHADLCRGMHVMGHAIDLDLSPNTCATYTKLGQWWESQGGVWGGRWTQFGECGDAGHFHYGFGGAGAVPTSVCPSDVSLSQCAQIREDYLDAAFAEGQRSGSWGLVAGAIIIGAAVGLLVATLRVKPGAVAGVFENPVPQASKWHLRKLRASGVHVPWKSGATPQRTAAQWGIYRDAQLMATVNPPAFPGGSYDITVREWLPFGGRSGFTLKEIRDLLKRANDQEAQGIELRRVGQKSMLKANPSGVAVEELVPGARLRLVRRAIYQDEGRAPVERESTKTISSVKVFEDKVLLKFKGILVRYAGTSSPVPKTFSGELVEGRLLSIWSSAGRAVRYEVEGIG